MATIGMSITKATSWRGETQEFSNVYHYNGLVPTEEDVPAILASLRDVEKPLHGSNVNFVRGALWGPTEQGKAASKMIDTVKWDFQTGSGGAATNAYYKEAAILIQWYLGRYGTRNRKQYLRKWIHPVNSSIVSVSMVTGDAKWGTTPAAIAAYITAVTQFTPSGAPSAGSYQLGTREGRPAGAGVLYPYLEHRQFGR